MKNVLSKKLLSGFAIAILLVAVNGLLALSTFNRQTAEDQWVEHTYRVIDKLNRLQNLINEIEVSRRGFRSTNNQYFLSEYYKNLPKVVPAISALKRALADNVLQLEQLERLEYVIGDLLDFYKALGAPDLKNFSREEILSRTFAEQRKIVEIRREIEKLKSAEYSLLSKREAQTSSLKTRTKNTILIGSVLILIIVVVLIFSLYREFKQRIKAQSELKQNLASVEQLNTTANEKNWALTGVSIINNTLYENDSLSPLINSCLNALIRYLDLPAAAIYIIGDDGASLHLYSAIGYSPKKKQVRLNEGLIGKVASGKELLIIKNIPEDNWQLDSSFGSIKPKELIGLPLWLNKELKGVIELAALDTVEPRKIEFLKVIANNIAIAINAALIREHMVELLEQVVKQKNELEVQQEELRQANEELQSKSEVLQVSEEELRQSNTELELKNQAIEKAKLDLISKAKELETANNYKSQFLANMSHELRTPLNSVLILSNLLLENGGQNLSKKQVEYAKIIYNSSTDLLELINDILDLSKIEAGKVHLNIEETPLSDILKDVTELFEPVALQRKIKFEVIVEKDVPSSLQTDKIRLEQIVKNLLSNAFKFTSAGGKVSLSFASAPTVPDENEPTLAISVEDTGIGIPEDKQQLIFEAFQQANGTTSRKYGGTGLGLSISKELAGMLGGRIEISSKEGVGSKFTLYVPFTSESAPNESEPDTAGSAAEIIQPKNRRRAYIENKNLLIIERESRIREIIDSVSLDCRVNVFKLDTATAKIKEDEMPDPDCVLVEIAGSTAREVEKIKVLKKEYQLEKVPVIAFISRDISTSEEFQIKKVCDTIIRQSEHEGERLQEELEHFFNRTIEDYPLPETPAREKTLMDKRVLLVDDDMRNVFALSSLLEEHYIEVITAVDGKEALMQLNENPDTDLVLMDIMMPEMDGLEAIARFREDPRFAKLPIIAVTAKAMAGDAEKCIAAGASDYITKPVDNNKLMLLVKTWLTKNS